MSDDLPVDPTNVDEARDWDGDDGQYWADHHGDFEGLLEAFDAPLLSAARLERDSRVLEVGCGTGATTRALATAVPNGRVLGVDLSGPMLSVAREGLAAAGLPNVDLVQADAQVYAFEPRSFDAAVSRCGVMFFGDPAAAFANVASAVRPGGRVAFMVWQAEELNEWGSELDAATATASAPADAGADERAADAVPVPRSGYEPGPFSLADPDLCRSLLEGAGLVDVAVTSQSLPLRLGRTVEEAYAFYSTWIEDGDPTAVADAQARLRALLVRLDTGDGLYLGSASWLLTGRSPG